MQFFWHRTNREKLKHRIGIKNCESVISRHTDSLFYLKIRPRSLQELLPSYSRATPGLPLSNSRVTSTPLTSYSRASPKLLFKILSNAQKLNPNVLQKIFVLKILNAFFKKANVFPSFLSRSLGVVPKNT